MKLERKSLGDSATPECRLKTDLMSRHHPAGEYGREGPDLPWKRNGCGVPSCPPSNSMRSVIASPISFPSVVWLGPKMADVLCDPIDRVNHTGVGQG